MACASLAKQAPRWAAEAHVLNDSTAATTRARTRPPRARIKRKRKESAAPASGQVSDWLSPAAPSRFSQDSHLDPRTFRGHSLQLGRVFDHGSRALHRPVIICAKFGAVYWERADALCRSRREHPGGRSSQHNLKSWVFPNRRHPGWTVEDVRRPSLAEATTLVAQLESCEAGLGRTVVGPTAPKKQRAAPQAAVLAHWERLSEVSKTWDSALQRWDQRRPGLLPAYGLNDLLMSKLAHKAEG